MTRREGSPTKAGLELPWYRRVLRASAGQKGFKQQQQPQGQLLRQKFQSKSIYLVFAAVAVCILVVWSVSYEIDFKDAVNSEQPDQEQRRGETTLQKLAVRKFGSDHELEKQVIDQADAIQEITSEEVYQAPPMDEDVKRLFTEIDAEMQQVFNSNQEFTKFGPRIENWDEQREEITKAKLMKNTRSSNAVGAAAEDLHRNDGDDDDDDQYYSSSSSKRDPGPRILLVTSSHPKSCPNQRGDQMLLKAIKNKMDYCRLHDIQIYYNLDNIDDDMTLWWVKVFLTHMLMRKHPEVDWIWWMDSDAIFTDMSFQLPLEKYANYNMVLHGWDDALYVKRSWLALNAGVFLIRNCQWSLDLLYAWAPMSPKGPVRDAIGPLLSKALPDRPPGESDDQSALVYLILSNREKWGSKVYLENSYYFQGYWRILTEKFEEMMAKYKPGVYGDDRWPFVTHFTGCEFCEGVINPGYTPQLCQTQMERAIKFADNQVINQYGFRHTTLEEAGSVESIQKSAEH
jgi:xyloglucan 6-xylosyltransferase